MYPLFKVLNEHGQSCHGGDFSWSLPAKGKPGEWTPLIDNPNCCYRGYHLVTDPLTWWQSRSRLFLAEPDWTTFHGDDSEKAAFYRCRLLEEIDRSWKPLIVFPRIRCFLAASEQLRDSTIDILWANLSGANLSRANLSRANLPRANLSRADLSGADLSGADLSRANLSRANLSGANLLTANLSGADLSGANLSGANLLTANLSGADLSGADLSGANLSGADLSGAFLSGANLSGADLSEANLSGAYLSDKQKHYAETQGARLCL